MALLFLAFIVVSLSLGSLKILMRYTLLSIFIFVGSSFLFCSMFIFLFISICFVFEYTSVLWKPVYVYCLKCGICQTLILSFRQVDIARKGRQILNETE